MKRRIPLEQVLDFAIAEEEAAAGFYARMTAAARRSDLGGIFEGLAASENRHKAKLEALRWICRVRARKQRVALRLADYATDPGLPLEVRDLAGLVALAERKEKTTSKLYGDLAACCPADALKKTFQILAQEEASHGTALQKIQSINSIY